MRVQLSPHLQHLGHSLAWVQCEFEVVLTMRHALGPHVVCVLCDDSPLKLLAVLSRTFTQVVLDVLQGCLFSRNGTLYLNTSCLFVEEGQVVIRSRISGTQLYSFSNYPCFCLFLLLLPHHQSLLPLDAQGSHLA